MERKLKIYYKIAHKWKEIATLLGLEQVIEGKDCYDCITNVLRQWCDNACQLPNARDYPKSWQGLINLLDDVQLGEVTKELKKALTSQTNSVRGIR